MAPCKYQFDAIQAVTYLCSLWFDNWQSHYQEQETQSHYQEQETQLLSGLSSFRIILSSDITNLRHMLVLLKITGSQDTSVCLWSGETSSPSPCPGKAQPWDQTGLLRALRSQGMKILHCWAVLTGKRLSKSSLQNIIMVGKHSWQQKRKIFPSSPNQIMWSAKIHKANKWIPSFVYFKSLPLFSWFYNTPSTTCIILPWQSDWLDWQTFQMLLTISFCKSNVFHYIQFLY